MHFNTNKKLLSCLLACTIFVSSCKKDSEEPKDVEAPEVNFKTIEEDKNVKGRVTLDLNTSDNNGVTRVEIYVNNTLIATITEAPYTFTWNTTNYPDGKYAVKAIAYDKEGNKKETVINVNVLNRLLKVIVPATAMVAWNDYTTISGWVFLSDSEGKTLGVKKFKNGDVLEFQSPENFNEEKVFLNVLRLDDVAHNHYPYTQASIRTTAVGVTEEITLSSSAVQTEKTIVGTSSININNIPEDQYMVLLPGYSHIEGNKGVISSMSKNLTSMSFGYDLYQSPVNNLLNVYFNDGQASKYKYYQNFELNQNLEVDYSSLSTMTGVLNFSYPEVDYFFSYLTANRIQGDNSTQHNLGYIFEPLEKIYYPENIFAEYRTYISTTKNGVRNAIFKIGGAPINTFQALEITNTISANSINNYSFTSSGTYDVYSFGFNYSNTSVTDPNYKYYFYWNIEGSQTTTVSGRLPELPLEIVKENQFLVRENLAVNSLSFTDYVGVTSEDYFKAYLNGETSSINKGYSTVSYPASTVNQRKSFSKKMDLSEINEMINNPNGFYPVR